MTDSLTIRRPDDWHLHLRDGDMLAAVLPDTARRFARAIVMPNLKPAVTTVKQAVDYLDRILAAVEGSDFEPLMTLYLTDNTSAEEIIAARKSCFIKGVKLYPAGATTNSDEGVTDIRKCDEPLEEMQRAGLRVVNASSTRRLASSGQTLPEIAEALGVDYFLVKPLPLPDLLAVVEEVLGG